MTSTAQTPEEAVAYLRDLGTGIRASVVLDEAGEVVACSSDDASRAARMGRLAADILSRADRASGGEEPDAVGAIEVSTPGGAVFAARRSRWAVAVVAERVTLSSLMLFDLHRLLLDLEAAAA